MSTTTLSGIQQVYQLTQQLLKAHKDMVRLNARTISTPGAAKKQAADAAFLGRYIIGIESRLHAACVDAGLADARTPEHYAPRPLKINGWREDMFVPTRPECLSGAKP